MKLDILAFAAHPDDVELSASGTLISEINKGKKVGIIDLTKGELGTRGTSETRKIEAQKASEIMGIHIRENLDLGDGFFEHNEETKRIIIDSIRKYQPEIVLCNAISDRHPDHARASKLVSDACFYAGLIKIETNHPAWRPKVVYHYIQDHFLKPDFVYDISNAMDKKMESILAYATQFYDPNSKEPETPISSKQFLEQVKGRSLQFGRMINAQYGEGFTIERPLGVDNLHDIK